MCTISADIDSEEFISITDVIALIDALLRTDH